MTLLGFERKDLTVLGGMLSMFLRDKYAGSVLGLAWAVLQPLLLLGVYTAVFGFVFRMRLPGTEAPFAYVVWLLVGLVPFQSIAEGLTGTAGSVLKTEAIVKNVLFKSEILPVAAAITAMVPLFVGLTFLVVVLVASGQGLTWHIVYVIPVAIVHLIFIAGVGMYLAATTVFVRDLMQALPTLVVLLMFCTPVFYALEMLPALVRDWMVFNPLYQIIEAYRAALYHHRPPDLAALGLMAGASLLLLWAGIGFFRRLKGYFELAL